MALGGSQIKMKDTVSSEISGPIGNIDLRADLHYHAGVNRWSFDGPKALTVDANKLVIFDTSVTNAKLADWRGYNHSAGTPDVAADFLQNINPGVSTFSITLVTYIYELNVKRINSAATHWVVDIYLSDSDRTNQINRHHRWTGAISFNTRVPYAGHSNQETQKPVGDFQTLTVTGIPTAGLSVPGSDDILYCDTYISNSGVTSEYIRFNNSYTDVNVHEYANPYVDAYAPNITSPSPPAGYTAVFPVVTNSLSNGSGVDFAETLRTGYGTFYWFLCGINGSNYHRLGNIACTADIKIYNPEGGSLQNTTQIFNGTLKNAASNSNESSGTGTLSSSYTWAYDDVADVEVSVSSYTGYDYFDLGTTPP